MLDALRQYLTYRGNAISTLVKQSHIIYTAMRIHRSAPYTAGKSCITQYFKAMDSNVNYLLHKAVMIPGRRRIAAGKRDSRRHARRMMQA